MKHRTNPYNELLMSGHGDVDTFGTVRTWFLCLAAPRCCDWNRAGNVLQQSMALAPQFPGSESHREPMGTLSEPRASMRFMG